MGSNRFWLYSKCADAVPPVLIAPRPEVVSTVSGTHPSRLKTTSWAGLVLLNGLESNMWGTVDVDVKWTMVETNDGSGSSTIFFARRLNFPLAWITINPLLPFFLLLITRCQWVVFSCWSFCIALLSWLVLSVNMFICLRSGSCHSSLA